MPAGSGSLRLLFTIEADDKDALDALKNTSAQMLGLTTAAATTTKSFQDLAKKQQEFLIGMLQGIKSEAQAALATVKGLTEQQVGMLQGMAATSDTILKAIENQAKTASGGIAKSFQTAGVSARQLTTVFNEGRRSLEEFGSGNAVEGLVTALRAAGTAGAAAGLVAGTGVGLIVLALGAAIVAVYSFVKATELIVSSAQEIGTRSRDDFDELQKKVESAGGHVTELQRQLSRGIVDALDQVKGASTGFMAVVIEKSAPALIGLLKEVADWLVRLEPLAVKAGNAMATAFNHANAAMQTFEELTPNIEKFFLRLLVPGLATGPSQHSFSDFADIYRQKLKEIDEANKAFKPGPAPFDPKKTKEVKQGLEEMAQAQADFDAAQRVANEERQAIADDAAHQILNRDQAADLLIAIEEKLFEAEKKRINAERDAALLNAKTSDQRAAINIKADNDILNSKSATAVKEKKINDDRITANQAADDKLIDEAIREDEKERKLAEDKHDFWFKQALDIQKAIEQANTDTVRPPGFVSQATGVEADIKSQVDALAPLTRAWRETQFSAQAYFDAVQKGTASIADANAQLDKMIQKLVDQSFQLLQAGKTWQAIGLFITKALPLAFLSAFNQQLHKMIDAYIETGHTGPAAMKQLVAGTLAALGEMASSWAAFAFSMALVALAMGQYHAAALYFAGGLGLEVLALALGFAASKVRPDSGGGTGSASTAAATLQPPNTTINLGPGVTGNQLGGTPGDLFGQVIASNNKQSDAIERLWGTIAMSSPGDVVTRAASTAPNAFATGVTNASKSNATFNRNLGLNLLPST